MKHDKLLFLGNSIGTKDAVTYAKGLGVTTVVTDFLPPEKNAEKLLADEYWMIDIYDLDTLVKKCREEHVTGVFAATSEYCLEQARKLCGCLGLPFYASEKGWKASRDKDYFKECCTRFGLHVPKEYRPDNACYPVIVKPADSCAQQGLSLCRNKEELASGLEKAEKHSASGKIMIEEYVSGIELVIMYLFRDGEPCLLSVLEFSYTPVNGRNNWARLTHRSRFYETFVRDTGQKVRDMLAYLECREGVAYVQVMYRGGVYYFLELGYRMDAIGTWRTLDVLTGANTMKWQVLLALGRKPEDTIPAPREVPADGKGNIIYFIWGNPGTVAEIKGLEQVRSMDGVEVFRENIAVGTEISATDNLRQVAYILHVRAKNDEALERMICDIRGHLHACDAMGQELLLYPGNRIPDRPMISN